MLVDTIIEQWQQQSIAEVFAFFLSIAYVYLAAKQNVLCWACAFVSTSLYTYLFYTVSLPFHTALNAYYIVMAIIGYLSWTGRGTERASPLEVRTLSAKWHLALLSAGILATLLLVWLATDWFNSELIILDAGVTVFSVLTTVLTARKFIDNWLYWMVINTVAIYLFISTQLYLTAILMLIYGVLAIFGWFEWRSSYKRATL